MISLINKNILITGASSGIGRECAIVLSKIGANIILIGRDLIRLQHTFDLLESNTHLICQMDVTEYDNIENIISDCVNKIGKIDGFVHCAGIEMTLPLQSMNNNKYDLLFSVNTIAAFEFSKILSKKKFFNVNGASFVFISSVAGLLGVHGKIGYCSSKAALIAGSKAMALELANKKIRVNTILPGMVDTEMFQKIKLQLNDEAIQEISKRHPLGIGNPNDVANLCAFLLSDLAKWITGSDYIIDGGYSCQ
jgi:NAD(P)-dependent dehydrogenase (short-subunit alcohol dehydrogenase family)